MSVSGYEERVQNTLKTGKCSYENALQRVEWDLGWWGL